MLIWSSGGRAGFTDLHHTSSSTNGDATIGLDTNTLPVCPPELKVRTPAHTTHLGWYV